MKAVREVAPLEGHSWRNTYFSDKGHDILREFLVPLLQEAKKYDRITGDFASAFLRVGALGFSSFFATGGTMRLVTNGCFNEADLEALKAGHDTEAVAEKAIQRDIETAIADASAYEEGHLKVFTWLLQTGRLRIKVAILPDAAGNPRAAGAEGDFHNKVGIVTTRGGKTIGFLGGLNESMRAYTRNSESIACRYSWKPHHQEELEEWQDFFETVWSGKAARSRIFDFPEAAAKALISTYNLQEAPSLSTPVEHEKPAENLWRHQDEAIEHFLDYQHGILEMATGTGKTRTALRVTAHLWDKEAINGLVVATKGNDLLSQWFREVVGFFGRGETRLYRMYEGFHESLQFLDSQHRKPVLIVSLDNLAKVIQQDRHDKLNRCLLIVDEVHNLGAPGLVQKLDGIQNRFTWRLGLSATPERAYDDAGNQFVENAIGKTIYRFGLEDAIRRGILCGFDYVPLTYQYTEADEARLQAVYAQKAAAEKEGDPWSDETLWTKLANVRKTAEGKLAPFKIYLENNSAILNRGLIFVENMDYGHCVQEVVVRHTLDYHTYYGGEDMSNLRRFADGALSCLVTCKKLSEGIDIRSVSTIVLFASDRGRLVTTQRIGRALRTDPLRPDKRAMVVDFVRQEDMNPPRLGEDPTADYDRFQWLTDLSHMRREP